MALSSVNANGGEIQEERFLQFDVVNDESDHSYLNHYNKKKGNKTTTDGPDCFSNASSGVHKKIMKEWKVLEKNLPETIYVRVYERRIDLLRAAIVGPAGTPYHDGLFIFDIAFPPDYPARPPYVQYRSFGLRINPNLYANGRVCLSLLNTWFGKANEKWNPGESTVLQILVSIQGLVLNRNPYFNEPGVGFFSGRNTKKSMAYTENSFVLSCTTMVYLLRRPPNNFEPFVSSHFRARANHILAACKAYADARAAVGCYGEAIGSGQIKVSSNFKALMKSWYPLLVAGFKQCGASLEDELLQFETKTTTPSKAITDGKKKKKKTTTTESGIRKLVGKLKKFLGIKKASVEKGIKVDSFSS